ncbi:MAG: cation:proton antiporter [OCS116 cluster bacterium]|uniref:Cation:proton antiporter n=1 Tax=OCS116 cluster bacterium TaxID=2030921 RepID=A0A2A4Z933_9PROT|nr:cation:proton antiporter [OCS116 cluster bacterium]
MENIYLDYATLIAQVLLIIAFVLVTIRLIIGPTLSDRILCLDVLVTLGIGFIAIFAIRTQQFAYIDVAIALGLIGFLATVAFARYILWQGQNQMQLDDNKSS